MKKLLRSPWIELSLMSVLVILSYIALVLISRGVETPPGGMTAGNISGLLFGFFLLSFVIAIIAVVAGIGGGVIFSPIMLAFTPVDSLIIRATGLIVAMFSGLISTGPFMKSGLGNLKLSLYCCCGYGVGAFVGAQSAIWAAGRLGIIGEGVIRIILGVIVFLLAFYFLWGGVKIEWPKVKQVDRFTQWLRINQPYYEESLGKVVDYRVTRAGFGLVAMCGVGMISGFFGMGAGWAIVPAMNLIMAVPLKVAAACSGVLIGMGDCIAVWPYLLVGAIIPLFAAPWLVGQVLGGLIGAQILIKVDAKSVRFILIGIMSFSSFGLITRGLKTLGYISAIPGTVYIAVFFIIMAGVVFALLGKFPKFRGGGDTYGKT
ncbi:hypothetical protein ES708_05082 [subsurface metagenome]